MRVPARDRGSPSRCRARSRYWPTHSSTRSSSKTGRAAGGAVPKQHVGVHEREVADEDRGALAETPGFAAPACRSCAVDELAVDRREPPPLVGAVHHVVVDERERVQQLERRAGVDDDAGRADRRRHRRTPSGRTRAAGACRPPRRARAGTPSGAPSAGSTAAQRVELVVEQVGDAAARPCRRPRRGSPGRARTRRVGHDASPAIVRRAASVRALRRIDPYHRRIVAEFLSSEWIAELDAAAGGGDLARRRPT